MKKQIIIAIAGLATASVVTWGIVSYRTARRISMCNACIGNQRMIDSAKEQWAMQTKTKSGPIDMQAVLFYIKGGTITCPAGGTYIFGEIGEDPSCSFHGRWGDRCLPKRQRSR